LCSSKSGSRIECGRESASRKDKSGRGCCRLRISACAQLCAARVASGGDRGDRGAGGAACLHAVYGRNGVSVWEQKRVEDRQLRKEIDDLNQENARLRDASKGSSPIRTPSARWRGPIALRQAQ